MPVILSVKIPRPARVQAGTSEENLTGITAWMIIYFSQDGQDSPPKPHSSTVEVAFASFSQFNDCPWREWNKWCKGYAWKGEVLISLSLSD
jgi:hypothetical protein